MRVKTRLIPLVIALGQCMAGYSSAGELDVPLIKGQFLPWGAMLKGNESGTIPEYSGPPPIPEGYDPSQPGVRPDPFKNESPLFVVTRENMHEYADNIPEGIKQMLEKYPSFKLNVYPSHRTANFPEFYKNNTIKNIDSCKTVSDGLGLEGCYAGLPFPFPETGNEVMWNRLLKYDQYAFSTRSQATRHVTAKGDVINTGAGPTYGQVPIFDPGRVGGCRS